MPNEPSITELIRGALESRLADVHVSMPGIVVSYDAVTQTASIQPALRRVLFDDNEDPVEEDPPILQNIPVKWPGGGGFYLHFPLAKGDTGELVFHERSNVEWRQTGALATPGDLRLHSFAYATFEPGLRDDKHPRADAPATGEGVLAVGDGVMRVGPSGGADFVALAAKVKAELDKIANAFSTFVPGSGGASFPDAYTTASSVAGTKLKTS